MSATPSTARAPRTGERTLHGEPARFASGLHEVATGAYAWLLPNGDWSENNAGLVVGDGASALIDTTWDLRLTRRLLADIAAETAAAPVSHLLLTHADGDHVNGAQLLPQARLVAARAALHELDHEDPAALHRSRLGAGLLGRVGIGAPRRFGAYVRWMMEPFDFRGITIRTPDTTFDGHLELEVGGWDLHLLHLGPAHTAGDTIVHMPATRTVFAGDLLFTGVTPNGWAGDIAHWRTALEAIAALAPEVIVPGHGPVSDLADLERLDHYWGWLQEQATRRLAAGLGVDETAFQLVTSDEFRAAPWGEWVCPERTVCSVISIDRARRGQSPAIGHRERARVMWRVAALAHRLQRHAAEQR